MKQSLFSISQNLKKVNSSLSLSLSLSHKCLNHSFLLSFFFTRLHAGMKRGAVALLFHLGLQNRSKDEWQKGVSGKLLRTREKRSKETAPPCFSQAFTIVELLIVIVIIAILAAITIISYTGISNRAKNSALSSTLQSGAKKVATYALQNSNTVPADKAAFLTITGYSDGNTTYQYTANTATTPNLFCITATQDSISYHIAGNADGAVNKPVQGPCLQPGTAIHSGTAPTKLPDGSSCPTNYILVPGSSTYNQDSFCVMKYEAKNDGSGNAVSTAAGTPWVNINWDNAKAKAAAIGSGYHLMTEAEWMTVAANVLSVGSNWSTGTVGSGYIYSGHNDGAPAAALAADTNDANGYSGATNTGGNQRRTLTLTNGQVIWDLAGNVLEWTGQTITGNQPGLTTDAAFTWREWNNASLQMNGLSQLSRPESISAAVATWSSSNGIGQLISYVGDTDTRVFLRGGMWAHFSNAGVTLLALTNTSAGVGPSIGFRVAR